MQCNPKLFSQRTFVRSRSRVLEGSAFRHCRYGTAVPGKGEGRERELRCTATSVLEGRVVGVYHGDRTTARVRVMTVHSQQTYHD